MKKNIEIKNIQLLYVNQPSRRKVKVVLSNGTRIYIESCYESWQQYGGTTEELWLTMPIAEKYNAWLHNEDRDEMPWDYGKHFD